MTQTTTTQRPMNRSWHLPKMTMERFLILLLYGFLLAGGCFSSPAVQEHYYLVHSPQKSQERGKGPRLMVADFTSAAGYDTARIAYRISSNELRFYAYKQWAAEPARMLAEATVRHLRASGQFAQVGQGDKMREPDAVLEGTVDTIEEVDEEDFWKARLAMTFYLRKAHSDQILLHHSFDITLPCAKRELTEVADRVSKILAMELEKLGRRLANAIPRPANSTTSRPQS